jgi:predicted nucleic acid-binding Zn ribbon protein
VSDQLHPCPICLAPIWDDEKRTCSLPCLIELQRRTSEIRQRRADRLGQLIEARVLPNGPTLQPIEPAKPRSKPPKKRARRR